MNGHKPITAEPPSAHSLREAETAAEHAVGLEPTQKLDRGVGYNLWTGNVVGAGAIALLGIYVMVSSVDFGFGTSSKLGAGVFPAAIGAFLLLMALLWLSQCMAGRIRREDEPADSDRAGHVKVALSIAVIIAFGLLVNVLGYQLMMLLVMATILTFIAKTKWWLTLILSAAMAFGTFVLFDRGLGVLLPVSSIQFLEAIGL